MRISFCLLLLAAIAVGAVLADDAGPRKSPAVGDRAPDFRLNDHHGKAFRLSDAHDGAWVILAFYPKADTPG